MLRFSRGECAGECAGAELVQRCRGIPELQRWCRAGADAGAYYRGIQVQWCSYGGECVLRFSNDDCGASYFAGVAAIRCRGVELESQRSSRFPDVQKCRGGAGAGAEGLRDCVCAVELGQGLRLDIEAL